MMRGRITAQTSKTLGKTMLFRAPLGDQATEDSGFIGILMVIRKPL